MSLSKIISYKVPYLKSKSKRNLKGIDNTNLLVQKYYKIMFLRYQNCDRKGLKFTTSANITVFDLHFIKVFKPRTIAIYIFRKTISLHDDKKLFYRNIGEKYNLDRKVLVRVWCRQNLTLISIFTNFKKPRSIISGADNLRFSQKCFKL